MRTYPRNSPQAAARILALSLLADGHVCQAEIDTLDRLDAHGHLGLPRAELHAVLHHVCEDLLAASQLGWSGTCAIDAQVLSELMADIDDPRLQSTLLRLCVAAVEADHLVTEGESTVLVAALAHWGLQQEVQRQTREPAAASA